VDQELEGALDMPMLKTVALGPLDGCGVLLPIRQISKNRLEIQLYPAPRRLEHQRISSPGGESENQQDYRLTTAGKGRFQTEAEKWNRLAEVISGIMATTHEEV
jgi:PadR family transcriptional regulator, regulatory protein PadR